MRAASPLDRECLLTLIPHAGRMCLLDKVVTHSQLDIHCTARGHRDADHPLRSHGQLSALHLAEYSAQAVAAHGALTGDGRARPGMLAALRDIHLHVARIDDLDCVLDIHAQRLLTQADRMLYGFHVLGDGRLLADGRIAIVFT